MATVFIQLGWKAFWSRMTAFAMVRSFRAIAMAMLVPQSCPHPDGG
ncbi:hypothetical protein MNBD_ALPHA07-1697 [hydrothermal vent metagenome]|uniref:Uncharacterized protein n=1 Tax=hydrothermal vent metagenome TaxID=652676 RepID=A0A3B0RKF9_9ZZZZ